MAESYSMKTRAISPTHITGFLEIRDKAPNVLRKGSRGAGICLSLSVETEVETNEEDGRIEVKINGVPSRAKVSRSVADTLLKLSRMKHGLLIRHRIPVPIGSGFGTSGAAALGVALAGSRALGIDWPPLRLAQLAHGVEVKLRTGLGTIAGEYFGGVEVRTREGAPGVGEVIRIPFHPRDTVVALHHGPLLTSKILSDQRFRNRINSIGGAYTDLIIRKPDLRTFLTLSQEFTSALGLATASQRRTINDLSNHGYPAAMAMFGRTIFTVVKENEINEVSRLMKMGKQGKIITSKISPMGARHA